MVEDALREGLAAGLLTQRCYEAEGLGHWQMCLHLDERGALAGILLEDAASAHVHARIDAAHGLLWAGDLHQEDR